MTNSDVSRILGEVSKYSSYKDFIEANMVDDVDAAKDIAELASKSLEENFDIYPDPNDKSRDGQAAIVLSVFDVVFREIIAKLIEKRNAEYQMYKFIIANRVEIGYDQSVSDEFEKNGGFIIYIKHLYHEKPIAVEKEYEDDTIDLCTAWNTINITSDTKVINDIASASVKLLNNLDIKLGSSELVMPIFATVYDAMITYLRIRRAELKEYDYTINFLSLFDVSAKESDGVDDTIVFVPAIEFKLGLKSDGKGSSQYE